MNISDAIRLRVDELLEENDLTTYRLAYLAGISPSVISDCQRGIKCLVDNYDIYKNIFYANMLHKK